MTTKTKLNEFTLAYIEAMLWSSCDDDDTPLDRNYSLADIAPETLARIIRDCTRFQAEMADDLACRDDKHGGHDFWLTRNGHGAGFWDGDWPEPHAARLTEAATDAGEVDPYVGDDGQVWL